LDHVTGDFCVIEHLSRTSDEPIITFSVTFG